MTKDKKLEVVRFMYDNNLSLREVVKEYPISLTRLYYFITDDLKKLDRVLYDEVSHQLSVRNTHNKIKG